MSSGFQQLFSCARKRAWPERDGQIPARQALGTSSMPALTGLSPMLEIGVYTREQVVAAIDRHLDELFTSQ